jgi:uncharacterized membrane protein YfcA
VPIALPALSVFAFLVFYALDLALTRRKTDPRATGFLALATVLPALASLVMLLISVTQLGTTCKLCVCIYVASALCLVGGLALWRQAVRGGGEPTSVRRGRQDELREPAFVGRGHRDPEPRDATRGGVNGPALPGGPPKGGSWESPPRIDARLVAVSGGGASAGFLAAMFVIGVGFVALPVMLYLALAPDHARFIGSCEGLAHPEDPYGVMLRVDHAARGEARPVPAIEVLDPLCPACKAFEQRLEASGLAGRLDRKAVLFPLDVPCNWMVSEATHPGACTVSEAALCAGDKAPDVIAWAFEHAEQVRDAARADPAAAARLVKQRFPELASCVGSPEARSRLNKSMRWIVANNIRVLTPQLFVDKVKLCDEDVDLGLEYTLSAMLDRHARGGLAVVPAEKPAPAAARPAGNTP